MEQKLSQSELDAYAKIIEILGWKKKKDGFYHTYYGRKSLEGLYEVMGGIMRDMGAIKQV